MLALANAGEAMKACDAIVVGSGQGSAMGHKRTSGSHRSYVRFAPQSGHASAPVACPLSAKSGRYVGRRICIAGTKAIKAMLPAMAKAAP
jgi:hypothetical protein